MTTPKTAGQVLQHYQLPDCPLFIVGTFDKGITVLSQQVRALNLVWALVESDTVSLDQAGPAGPDGEDLSRRRIAIIGAGFAGLTVAAGLLKKRVNADITIFEQRDTALPLQHGSDSRWLHPHIYDWPSQGSEAYSAALPVLNWTASRASDVVVQVLKEWKQIAGTDQPAPEGTMSPAPTVNIYCNTGHIQVSDEADPPAITVEWIGEQRDRSDPAVPAHGRPSPVGDSKPFDIVVLAVGFGLETGARLSYWRNETFAQPHLEHGRNTYIVSGSGDGAMIDLFRLRISHFRQDRILADLFAGHDDLLACLRAVHASSPGGVTFNQLRDVWDGTGGADDRLSGSAAEVQERLRNLLRQDTAVLLRVREPSFTNLFDGKRVSFQNRLLAYLLYRCGAFTMVTAPSEADLARLAKDRGVSAERIVLRHGTEKKAGLTDVLALGLKSKAATCFASPSKYQQDDLPAWSGGYFDMPGLTEDEQDRGRRTTDTVKATWRKEYLPSPTEAIATAFCSAVAGFVASATQTTRRLRVTVHRVLISGDEIVLQQCCDYQGVPAQDVPALKDKRAGRTFPAGNGTIGAAFRLRHVIRTRRGASNAALVADMSTMSLNEASQRMSDGVASVAAVPFLGAADSDAGRGRGVLGVLYLDSYDENAFVDDELMGRLVDMCNSFLRSLPAMTQTTSGRIANAEFWRHGSLREDRSPAADPSQWKALQVVADIDVPTTDRMWHMNFDFSDFIPVEKT